METLDAPEVAGLLHLNVKQVQKMAREGKLPAVRVGRKWIFQRALIERALSATPPPLGTGPFADESVSALSARNQLRGRVTALTVDGLMAEVRVAIGDQELVSIITRSSAERLGLAVGTEVFAVIKSTEVMIGRSGA